MTPEVAQILADAITNGAGEIAFAIIVAAFVRGVLND